MPGTRLLEKTLSSYWKLDSSHGSTVGQDAIGNDPLNLGTVGSTTGKVHEAASFTRAKSQYLAANNSTSLQSRKSFAFWVKFTTISNDMSLIHKGSNATAANSSVWIKFDSSNNRLQFQVGDGAGNSVAASTSGFTFATDTWYFVCCRYDTDADRLSISVNGNVYGTAVCTLNQYVETGTFYLGRDATGAYLDGALDEVCVSAASLTIAEESTLYNGGNGIQPPFLEGPIGVLSSSGRYPRRLPPSFAQAGNGKLLIAYGDEGVRRWDGLATSFQFAGVPAPTWKPALTSGGEGRIIGDRYAYVRYLDADGRVSNLSPISNKHEAFGSYKTITGATNSAPIMVTSPSHGLTTGEFINIKGVQGNTAANGDWYVTVIDPNTFSLVGSVGNGDFLAVDTGRVSVTTLRNGAPGVNEVQKITGSSTPTGGTWTISFNGNTTSDLAHNANYSAVQSALELLPSIGSGNVTVTGGPLGTAPFVVTFIGALAGQNQPLLTVDGSKLLGAASNITITTTQQGSPGPSEVQTITASGVPSGGTWTVTHNGATTSALAHNINAAALQAALEALPTIGSGNIAVTGGGLGTTPFTCTFQGALASTAQPQMTTSNSLLGANVNVEVAVLTEGDPGTNEVQEFQLYGSPTGGTFTLTFNGQTTAPIAYNADNATIKTALENLSNIGAGDITISGGPLPDSPVTVTFGGSLADTNVPEMTINGAGLTGGTISVSVSTVTQGAPDINNGLKAYYKLEELSGKRYDSVGSYDLSASGNPSAIQGVVGNGAYLSSNFLEHYSSNDSIIKLKNGATIAFWHKLPYIYVGSASLLSYSNDLNGISIKYEYSGPYPYKHKYIAYVNTGFTASPNYTDQPWRHVVVRYIPSSNSIEVSIDTLNYFSNNHPTINYDQDSKSNYIKLTDSGASYFDELGLWSRPLSDAEIAYLYNGGAGRTAPFPDGANEIQRITVNGNPTQGTFTLTYSGKTTSPLSYSATAAQVQAALEALPNIGTGNVACTGGPLPNSPVDVEFKGALAYTDVPQITADDNGLKTRIATIMQGSGHQNEMQRLKATPTPISGTFTLTFGGETTSPLAYNASAAQIQTALQALASIGSGNVACSGGPINSASVTVAFQGALAETNVETITSSSSMLGVTPTLTVNTTTDGGPGPNEIQRISASPTPITGTFTLTFNGQTTSPLAYNASAATVQAALESLSSIGSGNISVANGPLSSGTPFDCTFQGALAQTNVPQMTASSSMTGQAGAVTVSVTTEGAGPINERQQIFISGTITGGTYTLTYDGQTTSPLNYASTAEEVETALKALSNIGDNDLTTDGGPLISLPINVEFTGSLGGKNVSEMTVDNSGITAGGFARGAQYLVYTNIQPATDRRVVRRQILRNKFGDAGTFYVDIDTTDLTSTSFTSYKTDEELLEAVPLQDFNGFDLNVVRHGEPPNSKRAIAAFLNRVFLAVSHRSTSGELAATNLSKTLVGQDAFFRTAYDGRTVYPIDATNSQPYLIDSLNVGSQTITANTAYAGKTGNGIAYGLEMALPDDLTINFSELDDAEAWNALNGLTIERVQEDGRLTGLCPLITSLLILCEHRLYKLTFRASPLLSNNPETGGDGRIIPAASRGCVNNRCAVRAGPLVYLLDSQGIYSYDDNAVRELSDPIVPMFSPGHKWSIYWPAREMFHGVYDAENETIKWFVVIGDGQYPRHAICYETQRQRWWLEEYPWPITSSTQGFLDGRQVVFLGSTHRRIFVSEGHLDGLDVETYGSFTLRGKVTSSNAYSLTDSTATFPTFPSTALQNVPVTIVSGKGAGQQNIIVSNTATKLTLLRQWTIAPDTTSVYQIGGVLWKWKSTRMQLSLRNSESLRGVQVSMNPTKRAGTIVLRKYADFNTEADTFSMDYSSDGVTTSNNSDQVLLDTAHEPGFMELASDGFFGFRGRHQRYTTIELTGVTNGERQQVSEIAVVGAES